MHVAPERLLELGGSNNLAGVSEQESKRGHFFGRQMDLGLIAKETAVRPQLEAAEDEFWLPRIW